MKYRSPDLLVAAVQTHGSSSTDSSLAKRPCYRLLHCILQDTLVAECQVKFIPAVTFLYGYFTVSLPYVWILHCLVCPSPPFRPGVASTGLLVLLAIQGHRLVIRQQILCLLQPRRGTLVKCHPRALCARDSTVLTTFDSLTIDEFKLQACPSSSQIPFQQPLSFDWRRDPSASLSSADFAFSSTFEWSPALRRPLPCRSLRVFPPRLFAGPR